MNELKEKIARAICESERMNPDDALGGWIHWQEASEAALRAIEEAGYVVVPKLPTTEMIKEGLEARQDWTGASVVYCRMVAAAPRNLEEPRG